MIVSYLLLFRIETHALTDMIVTVGTPDVEGKFKSNDQDALVEFVSPTA